MLLKSLKNTTILGSALTLGIAQTLTAQSLGTDLNIQIEDDDIRDLIDAGVTMECLEEALIGTDYNPADMEVEFFVAEDGVCTLDIAAIQDAGIMPVNEADVAITDDVEVGVEAEGDDQPVVVIEENIETDIEMEADIAGEAEAMEDAEMVESEPETNGDVEVTSGVEMTAEEESPIILSEDTEADPIESLENAMEVDAGAETTAEVEIVEEEESPKASASTDIEADVTDDETVMVETETVTEETSRSSDEDVVVEADVQNEDDNDRRDRLLTILGSAAIGAVVGSLIDNDEEIVEDTGDRVIVRRNGELEVRKDENEILRRPGSTVTTQTYDDGSTRTIVDRPDGVRVLTIRDQYGYSVYRSRILPDGREIVLFDDRQPAPEVEVVDLPTAQPEEDRIEYSSTDINALIIAMMNQNAAELDRGFTLRQIRENSQLRDYASPIDLDNINFETGSAAITPSEARDLDALGRALSAIIADNPEEVFLIEGHTDAVGSETLNLALSDRRAESVALALTEYYAVPPENLIVQGYGERYLKIDTERAERLNRRATIRRITPLLLSARSN